MSKLFTEYNSIVQEEKRSIQNNTIKLIALQEDSNKNIESLKQKKYEQQIQLESNIDVKKLNEKRQDLISEGKNIKSVYDSIYNEFKEKIEEGGFILAHWDGTPETEEKIKEETKATIRCIPLDGDQTPGVCMVTGKPSAQRVIFARSY